MLKVQNYNFSPVHFSFLFLNNATASIVSKRPGFNARLLKSTKVDYFRLFTCFHRGSVCDDEVSQHCGALKLKNYNLSLANI